jgi:hypothetical protein
MSAVIYGESTILIWMSIFSCISRSTNAKIPRVADKTRGQ